MSLSDEEVDKIGIDWYYNAALQESSLADTFKAGWRACEQRICTSLDVHKDERWPSEDEIVDAACEKYAVAIRNPNESDIAGQVRIIGARLCFEDGVNWLKERLKARGE